MSFAPSCESRVLGGSMTGAPGGTRTPDPQVRSLMLYPAELPARIGLASGRSPSHERHSGSKARRKPWVSGWITDAARIRQRGCTQPADLW